MDGGEGGQGHESRQYTYVLPIRTIVTFTVAKMLFVPGLMLIIIRFLVPLWLPGDFVHVKTLLVVLVVQATSPATSLAIVGLHVSKQRRVAEAMALAILVQTGVFCFVILATGIIGLSFVDELYGTV